MSVRGRTCRIEPVDAEGRSWPWPQRIRPHIAAKLVMSEQVRLARPLGDAGKRWLKSLEARGVAARHEGRGLYRLTAPPHLPWSKRRPPIRPEVAEPQPETRSA